MQVKKRNSWEILRDHLADDNSSGLNEYLSALSGEESLRALMRLEADEQQQILARLTPESAADVIEFIPDEPAGDLLGELSPQVAASGPILTTITDMCGFFLLLGTASLMLPLLTGA